jgi:homospermidine synthase
MAMRTNYAMREEMLALRRSLPPGGPTCLVTHGANPGLVSHLVKKALLDIAAACGPADESGAAAEGSAAAAAGAGAEEPTSREEWAALAQRLSVKVIHISERDTQVCAEPKRPDEFVNTWSVDGFVSEGCQPAELGWGSHETDLPADGVEHCSGERAAIYLRRPGAQTLVRTWAPQAGAFHGFLITHNESISIADYLTIRSPSALPPAASPSSAAALVGANGCCKLGGLLYRPTVHYAYHPCDAAVASLHELAGRNFVQQTAKRLIVSEVTDGSDELGVLLGGAAPGAYWLGSNLSAKRAKELAPDNSATTLQVTATMLGGVVFAIEHPSEGILEPEEVPEWRRILDVAMPYIGPLVGVFTDWTPLTGRDEGGLFPAVVDRKEPWRFGNVRVQ